MGTAIEDQRLDSLFTALSDRTRRDIVARLSAGEATVKELAEPYAELYRGGSYVLRSYAADLAERVRPVLRRHGLDRATGWRRPSQVRSRTA